MITTLKTVMHHPRRLVRIIGLLALALTLQACSAIKIAYNNAPDLTYWWVDSYVDLNDPQSVRLRDDLGRLHQWHRANELPRYAELLQKMQQMMPATLGPEPVCTVFSDIQERFNALTQQAEPAVVALAMSMTPEQITHLERQYAKKDADYRREWMDDAPADIQKKRFDQTVERAEMIYGTLDDTQRNVIRQQLAQTGFDARLQYAERLRRQQDAVQTLRKIIADKAAYADARAALRSYLERSLRSPNPVYRQYAETLRTEGCRRFAAAHNATTPAQRDTAVRRLRAYERDLRELAAQR